MPREEKENLRLVFPGITGNGNSRSPLVDVWGGGQLFLFPSNDRLARHHYHHIRYEARLSFDKVDAEDASANTEHRVMLFSSFMIVAITTIIIVIIIIIIITAPGEAIQ